MFLPTRRCLSSLLVSFGIGLALNAGDFTEQYQNVSCAQEALKIMQDNDDINALLISPISFDQMGQKIITIYRGKIDSITQTGENGIKSKLTNAGGDSFGNIDFSKKPKDMSVKDFMDACRHTHITKLFTDFSDYELNINTKTKTVTISDSYGFEVKKMGDGAILILFGKKSPASQKNYSVSL